MKKGVSIPINTLVMLAVAIIVLLAAVAWFMGAFAPAATESSLKQRFESSCLMWAAGNCGNSTDAGATCIGGECIPPKVYDNYEVWAGVPSTFSEIARACGCSEPFGKLRP